MKSDIFSLGITVYEMITLENLEKNGEKWHSLRNGQFQYPPEIESNYSPNFLMIIRCMLAENTVDRPGAKQLLETFFVSDERQIIN